METLLMLLKKIYTNNLFFYNFIEPHQINHAYNKMINLFFYDNK